MAGYIINDTDTTTPLSFGTAETACGIVADLVTHAGFRAWMDTWSDTLSGWSGVLWTCIELARHAEAHVAAHAGWGEGFEFYEATDAIADALIRCAQVGDTDAMKTAVIAALDGLRPLNDPSRTGT